MVHVKVKHGDAADTEVPVPAAGGRGGGSSESNLIRAKQSDCCMFLIKPAYSHTALSTAQCRAVPSPRTTTHTTTHHHHHHHHRRRHSHSHCVGGANGGVVEQAEAVAAGRGAGQGGQAAGGGDSSTHYTSTLLPSPAARGQLWLRRQRLLAPFQRVRSDAAVHLNPPRDSRLPHEAV